MRAASISAAICLLITGCGGILDRGASAVPPNPNYRIGLQFLASRDLDAAIIAAAGESSARDKRKVRVGEKVVAHWVELRDGVELPKDAVLRDNGGAVKEVLLLVTSHDVTDRHVSVFAASTGIDGSPALCAQLTDSGTSHLRALTEANLGRQLGTVMNGKLYGHDKIMEPIMNLNIQFPGQFTSAEVDMILNAFKHQ